MNLKKLLVTALAVTVFIAAYIPTGKMPDVSAAAVKGDINEDGSFDNNDILIMQNWLLAVPDTYIEDWEAGDLCEDGCLNVYDLFMMKRMLAERSEGELIEPAVRNFGPFAPTTGNLRMLNIYVEFADKKFSSGDYSAEQIQNEFYGDGSTEPPLESITAWYERASYGNLHVDGDVYRYTCKGKMREYSQGQNDYEPMIMEVLSGLDKQIDYSDYDSNGDGYIDCLTFTVPLDNASDEMKNYWYSGTTVWYRNPEFAVDGLKVPNYSIIDVMPNAKNMKELKQTLLHEMGHLFGLADYYLYYNGEQGQYYGTEGLKGNAGYERMDDAIGDLCSFSKLMLGWLKDTEVRRYDGSGMQKFTLEDASKAGSCLILPINSSSDDYTSEYFLVEYVTQTGNNADVASYTDDSGIRIFHIRADLGDTMFKYENFSESYMGNDKIRIIRLVNDGKGFYHTGDRITFGTLNFAGYDSSGKQSVDTGYTISVGRLIDGKYTITVRK